MQPSNIEQLTSQRNAQKIRPKANGRSRALMQEIVERATRVGRIWRDVFDEGNCSDRAYFYYRNDTRMRPSTEKRLRTALAVIESMGGKA